MITTISVTFGRTIVQNFGFIFKSYLYLIGENTGALITLLLVYGGIYIMLMMISSFVNARKYRTKSYPTFALYFLPLLVIVEKIGSIMFIIVMFLEWKLIFLAIHIPLASLFMLLSIVLKLDFNPITDKPSKDDRFSLYKKADCFIARLYMESINGIYPTYYPFSSPSPFESMYIIKFLPLLYKLGCKLPS
jgi:hypothetical protein